MQANTNADAIESFLSRSIENAYPNREFVEARMKEGKPLSLYVGIDPTGPTLHLGHAIWLRKLREWQNMGHKVILLIGDFTAMIGDPTDKGAARKQLTRDEVLANCAKYKEQASRFVRFDGENAAELKFNSEWLGKMSFADVLDLASRFTVQQMLERDMFEKRMEEQKPIYIHEFMYPLMQGYDSVAMGVDGEMGGNDQTFNMLAGRTLMKEMRGAEKFVLTVKLLADATGKKMGKSEGNMITFLDSPDDMFGKVMSWTDGMIVGGFELCTEVPSDEVARVSKSLIRDEANPRDLKARLAKEVVRMFYGDADADAAEERFNALFRDKKGPDAEQVVEVRVDAAPARLLEVLVAAGFVQSKGDARRQIEQGGVKVDGEVVRDLNATVAAGAMIQKGPRHFAKVTRD